MPNLDDKRRDKERCCECNTVLTVKEKETYIDMCTTCVSYSVDEINDND